jgi:hypothetical protein
VIAAWAEDSQLRLGLFEPAVGVEQPWEVGVHPQRFEHVGRLDTGQPRHLALGEEEGDLGAQSGVVVGDSREA